MNGKFIQPHLGSGMSNNGVATEARAPKIERHTLSALVNNKAGVLTKIAGLYARRGYNIESLVVNPTPDPSVSRMTIVVQVEDELVIDQIVKQMAKLIDVLHIKDLTGDNVVEREMSLIKVKATSETRGEILQLVNEIFRANIVDVSETSLIVAVVGDEEKVSACEKQLSNFGLVEAVRTGKIVLKRGPGGT